MKEKTGKVKRKGKVGACGGRKECDLFAGILHQCLRRRQWTSIEGEGGSENLRQVADRHSDVANPSVALRGSLH